jgi:transglutaminase-like putative cysteine protease
VRIGPHLIRLRPAPHTRTPNLSDSLWIEPQQHFLNWQQDPQRNFLARLVVPDPAHELRVSVDLVAEMARFASGYLIQLVPDQPRSPLTKGRSPR